MHAEETKANEELIAELRAKIESTSIKEISPSGVRVELNVRGQVTGRYNASHIETASLLLKPDGNYDWETKAIETTKEGEMIVAWGGGRGRSTGADSSSWEGDIQYMTQSPRLSWLNNTTVGVEGTANMTSLDVKGRSYSKADGRQITSYA